MYVLHKIGFSIYIASIFFILTSIILSGGIHEDGLADFTDGIFGGKNFEKRLEIMSDSRIGVFGTIAIVISILLKFLSISQLNVNLASYLYLILISMNSRYLLLFLLKFLKPLKTSGLGGTYKISNYSTLITGFIPICILLIFLNYFGLVIFTVMLISCVIFMLLIWIFFEGQTGDICGASQQITELNGLLILTILI